MFEGSKPRRNLVTGGTGFLGSHLIESLSSRGEQVVALVRSTSDRTHLDDLGVEVIEVNFSDGPALADCFAGVHRVFNCAAMVSDWGDWDSFRRANVTNVRSLLEASSRANVQLFVHVSSTDVYGHPDLAVDESAPFRRRGFPYGDTKIEAEELVWSYARDFDLPVVVVRPASIYGPRSSTFGDLAYEMLEQRVPLIPVQRSAGLIEVTNAVHATLLLAENPNTANRAYNLTDGTDASFVDYFGRLAQELGLPHPRLLRIPPKVAYFLAGVIEFAYVSLRLQSAPPLTKAAVAMLTTEQGFSNQRLRDDVGYEPRVDLDEGIRRLGEDLRARRSARALSIGRLRR